MTNTDLVTLAINAVRTLSIDAVQQANSGHPGLPMGAAPMAYALWAEHMAYNPQDPHWLNRDRFVLSAGHGSMLLYSLLYLTGYDLPLDQIKNFRQWGSQTPGHPEAYHTPGVETTTGPLGQGISTAVGLALAEAFLADRYNTDEQTIIDHYTYVIASDGDIQEGISNEACSLAAHWGLNKLIVLYDANNITLDGEASMTMSEDVGARYAALGWHVIRVEDGDDYQPVSEAIGQAKAETTRPTLIVITTTIGFGSPNKAGTSSAHGSPLGPDEVKATKQNLGWAYDDPFHIPDEALAVWRRAGEKGTATQADWQLIYDAWKLANPGLAAGLEDALAGKLPDDWDSDLPVFEEPTATRNSAGDALRAIAAKLPTMIGGDADLAGSTKTLQPDAAHTGYHTAAAKNIRFGIREHAMGAIVNGLALHGGIVKPYSATFLTFSDYMRGAIRLGALMELPVAYIFTHDSIGLGEDGPTHQPIEQLTMLRATPNLYVFRPGDPNESVEAWRTAMMLDKPVAFALTRQKVPALSGDHIAEGVAHGGYTYATCDGVPAVILIGTGSELQLVIAAYKRLMDAGIAARVVSMPCVELFEEQDATYQESVLPNSVTARVSIEAGATLGWYKYVGRAGVALGVDTFGASAPYEKIYEEYGLTVDAVVAAAKAQLEA